MNRTLNILLGTLLTVVASLIGLVLWPHHQLGALDAATVHGSAGQIVRYPAPPRAYDEQPGRDVYVAQGCIYCHSQQVRPASFGSDIERGWGMRRSVPRDYLFDAPPLLGTMRTGPDVANIGARQPSDQWHHLHLFDARLVSPGSIMPPMPFLYQVVTQDPGAKGYLIPTSPNSAPRYIVPTTQALQLVAYLKYLHQDHELAQVL